MRLSRWIQATAVVTVLGLSIALIDARIGSASDLDEVSGDGPFVVEKVVMTENILEVFVRSRISGAELAAHPILVTDNGVHTGSTRSSSDGTFVIIFDEVNELGASPLLELPSISVPIGADFTSASNAQAFNGPSGHRYTITAIERVASKRDGISDGATERDVINVRYEPIDGQAPVVDRASLSYGTGEVPAVAVASAYAPTGDLVFGVMTFPLEAETLLNSGGASLRLQQFRSIDDQRFDLTKHLGS